MATRQSRSAGRITLKDVAEAAGASTAAVSYAYTRPDRLSKELRSRILETAQKLGYPGPDPLARNLRRGETGAIGVVVADPLPDTFSNPTTVPFVQGAARVIEAASLCLLLIPGTLRRVSNLKSVNGAAVDGMIVYSIDDRHPLVEAVLARRVPTVLVDSEAIENVATVGIDNEKAAQTAAEHLLALGHRRFGIITIGSALESTRGLVHVRTLRSTVSADLRGRLRGYAKALRGAGLSFEDSVSIYSCGDSVENDGARAAQILMSLRPRPTALLAMSDQLALQALAGVVESGLHVPTDVSIVGFDDIPAAASAKPALTTVHQPLADKGFWAATILLALIRGEQPPTPGTLPTHLVVRDSTAAPARAKSEAGAGGRRE
ncbi:MAG: LacI family DNA-binding transcriptional regulator [Proteobacteria bacterium]|nr:LacI family DNA-binding transcriptional regulator [Pseudomonadota bacterium]